jgi:hypothetical protein
MQRRPSLIGPLILITFGVLLLLANQGLLPLTFWEIAARYWPLIFILIGLEIIVGRQSMAGALIVLILWVVIVGGVLWYSFTQSSLPASAGITDEIAQPLGDIKSATIDLDLGITRVELNALDAGATDLMRGTFTHAQGARLVKSYSVAGSEGRLALKEEGVNFMLGGSSPSRWNIGLNSQIPIGLRINGGIGSAKIDLSALNIPTLTIDTGVGSLSITLPQNGVTSVRVNGGVGGLLIVIPQNVAARITVDQGIGNIQVDQARFPKAGNSYQSADYATTPNRVDITIDGGLGSINIR